ncbi:exodeoxyribonuclease V subunit beta [Gordonia sinesedis]
MSTTEQSAADAAATRVPDTFDITRPLSPGTTVLEASAGTGKTHAIVGIAAKHIADGLPIAKLLLVTFSRSASAELRERMRDRLTELVAALPATDDASAPGGAGIGATGIGATGIADAATGDDPLLAELLSGSAADVALRRERLVRALSDFDASTIATTHTFCNRMLEALGFLGERELIADIVEDTDDLVAEAALDLYLKRFAGEENSPPFSLADAQAIAKDAVRNTGIALAPDLGDEPVDPADSSAADRAATMRVRFCRVVRDVVDQRKRTARLRTYDDLQMILYRIVTDDEIGEAACRRIRDTFDLVLVDEFQDTDPFQWAILRRCFHGERQLVLVGDPKQSIYAFRGAEVLSYLRAVADADALLALDTNWRSDAALVDALSSIYGGAGLGDRAIVVHPVTAARPGSRLSGAPALRLKAFTRSDFPVRTLSGDLPRVGAVRDRVIDDVADDIAHLLNSEARLDDPDLGSRPVLPADVAVLVRANKTIAPLQQALAARGIASVVGTGTSVFRTAAASHWLWLIRAIEQPSRADRVRLAALTPLIGWSAEQLADADEDALAELASYLVELGRVFAQGGFAAMAQRVLSGREVARRVLATADGERTLTDLLQVSSLSNKQVVEQESGLAALAEWLADRIADDSQWRRHEDQTRRLDRDTHVVQIMTVHASKGLQFPIVYAPFAWDVSRVRDPKTFRYHDDAGIRHLDVGGPATPGRSERMARSIAEDAGEDLRLLYVALTRARSQAVVWWAPSTVTAESPLHRLVFGRADTSDPAGADAATQVRATSPADIPETVPIPDDRACVARLTELASGTDAITVEHAGVLDHVTWHPVDEPGEHIDLDVARFGRTIDQNWRRTSYSAIVAGAGHHHAHPLIDSGSEPETELVADEPPEPSGTAEISDQLDGADGGLTLAPADTMTAPVGTPSPMNGLPYGAAFGTLVHEVLEYVDTAQPDMVAHVRDLCAAATARLATSIDAEVLTEALVGVLTTPLGFGDLWSIGPRDRLAELDFEFPLGGDGTPNDDAHRSASAGPALAEIAGALRHHLDPTDPLVGYADVLVDLPPQRLHGFLTGSIDSVLRTPDGRYVVVDYKTNRLRPGPLTAEDFSREAMATEMMHAHYPLQALLYSVALHRYLRWRLPGYDPTRHLGPIQYHFVRGMVGPDTPAGCGVFQWDVPAALVVELSDLLAGRKP